MTSHRTISLTLALLAVLVASAPSSAFAGSLLSGYGGPGEGNQAILGSALLGGGGSAGGGHGSSGGFSGSTGSLPTGTVGVGVQVGHGNAASTGSDVQSGRASAGSSSSYLVSERGGPAQMAVADPGMLGLSGPDLLYVLLVLSVLALTAVLTRRLTRIAVTGSTGS